MVTTLHYTYNNMKCSSAGVVCANSYIYASSFISTSRSAISTNPLLFLSSFFYPSFPITLITFPVQMLSEIPYQFHYFFIPDKNLLPLWYSLLAVIVIDGSYHVMLSLTCVGLLYTVHWITIKTSMCYKSTKTSKRLSNVIHFLKQQVWWIRIRSHLICTWWHCTCQRW